MKAKVLAAVCAGVLTAAAAAGCSGSGGSSAGEASSAPEIRQTETSSAADSEGSAADSALYPAAESDAIQESDSTGTELTSEGEPVLIMDPVDALADKLPDERLDISDVRLLCAAPVTETERQALPSERLFEKKYGGRLVVDAAPKGELWGRLTAAVMSNEAPDLVPTDTADLFPRAAADRLLVPVDAVVDTSDELWTAAEEYSAAFNYRGKRYALVFENRPEYVCIYNKNTFRENGLEDPAALYRQGVWSHGWFETLCRSFTEKGSDRIAIDGEDFAAALSESCGVPLITMKGGQVVSNLDDSRLAETQDWMFSLAEQGLCAEVPQWGISSGKTLFCPVKLSALELDRASAERFGDTGDVMLLPMPKDEEACISAVPHGFCFPAGSKNPKGAAAYLRCFYAAGEADREAEERRLTEDCGWSEEMLEMRRECFRLAQENPVTDFSEGLPLEIYERLLKGVLGRTMSGGGNAVSWDETVEELKKQLDFAVMTANDTEPVGP